MPIEKMTDVAGFRRSVHAVPLDPGGGGPHGPSMEVRMAVIEKTVQTIERDLAEIKKDQRSMLKSGWVAFLLTWGGLISLGGILVSLMARGFGWL